MLSQQDMSDRLDIQDLLAKYCDAIDTRDFMALDDVFTADAIIDYTEAGGSKGTVAETKEFLTEALAKFSNMQHMIGLPLIRIHGDTAHVRTALYNPMILNNNGKAEIFFVGMWYRDKMVRTKQGWRISERREEACYFHDMPESLSQ